MSSISLQFDRPWALLLLIPAVILILFPFFRLPAVRRKSFKRIVPAVLHCVIAAILVTLMAGTTVVSTSNEQQVMILLDLSDSTRKVQDEITEKADILRSLLDKSATVGMMAFADDSVYEISVDSADELNIRKLDTDATDIASALTVAAAAMSSDKGERIILLSDGKQTRNDASAIAYSLNNSGIRVDAMYFDTTDDGTPEVQISTVQSTEGGFVGDTVTITAEITSNTAEAAVLTLFDNDTEAGSMVLALEEGSNIVTMDVTAETTGIHVYYMELETESDTVTENNSAYAYADIAGGASVLIICNRLADSTSLMALLENSMSVTTVIARKAPETIIEMCNYDEVVLLNVDYEDLPEGFDALAKTYVEDYGRSLLTVGGKGTMMYGNMEGTELEDLLPVEMSLSETGEGQSVAIMLVIDCSSSMTQNSNYLTLAKQGAIKCVEALSDADYAGVISFNSTATVNQSLTQTTEDNIAVISRTISGLTTSRGTYYTQALKLAYEELSESTADIKYVMFLSDGAPQDNGYLGMARTMAENGITVSTIGIGGTYSALSDIAEYGMGRYYAVTRATDLPDIMLSETEQVVVSSYITGDITVTVGNNGTVTEGIENSDIPHLTGYLGTTLKDEAAAYLVTDDGRPIYAMWQYGAGISAVFTSDLSSGWSAEWFESDLGQELIEKIIEAGTGESHSDSAMDISFTRYGDTVKVIVTTSGDTGEGRVVLSVAGNGGTDITELALTAGGTYTGYFELDGAGIYETIATWTDADGGLLDYVQSAYAAMYSEEYNAFAASGKSMLEAIVSYSGGKVTVDMEYLASVHVTGVSEITDPFILLSILAAVLFLIDVAIRKVRWKDLLNNMVVVFKK